MSKLEIGSRYNINNKSYVIAWSGFKYSFCYSYNSRTEKYDRELLKNSKLIQGEYCPF